MLVWKSSPDGSFLGGLLDLPREQTKDLMSGSGTSSPDTLKARRTWVDTYRKTGNAGLTCCRCGISRPTLRKWDRRFKADGEAGLLSKSRRPHKTAESKRTDDLTDRAIALRKERNWGSRRLQAELLRVDGVRLSTSTLHRVLADADVKLRHIRPCSPHLTGR